MKSSARLNSSHLVIEPRGWARILAPYPRRLQIPLAKVHEEAEMTTCDVIAMLGWRILGTGITQLHEFVRGCCSWLAYHIASGPRLFVSFSRLVAQQTWT